MHEVSETRYELVKGRDVLPAGQVCRVLESSGLVVVQIHPLAATQVLCDELNAYHRVIHGERRWEQAPGGAPNRVDQPAQGLTTAEARWVLDHRHRLPASVVCLPIEKRASFTWLIRPGEASEQLVCEMNRFLERVVGDGLWRQTRPKQD